jgi:enoyl-CoA hydratase/carnithine racemase
VETDSLKFGEKVNSMRYQTPIYQKIGNVVIINIISAARDQVELARLADELTELCHEIASDEEVRVIVLTGAGENFFAGKTDLIGLFSQIDEEQQKKVLSLTEPITKLGQPVIAVINGDAIGHGLELALVCDIRIATETSRFGFPQIKDGLIPWDGGTQRLSRLVGRGKAIEMILTGEMIDAREAYRIGLVNKVVHADKLLATAMDMAQEMAAKGPIALRYAKEAIYQGMDMTLEQGLRLEADLYLLIHTAKDRTEGIRAFQEKRIPKFEGR